MSRTPRSRRTVLALAAALLLLAGCSAGGSDDSAERGDASSTTTEAASTTTETPSTSEPDDEPTTTVGGGDSASKAAYVDAVADAMREADDSEFPIDDEQAACLAPRWVDAIGYETLLEVGVTPEVLGGTEDGDPTAEFEDVVDRPRAEKLVDAFGECGLDLEGLFFDGLASDGSATPEQVECLRGRLPDGFVRNLMVTSMDGGDEALDADPDLEDQLTGAFTACLDAD